MPAGRPLKFTTGRQIKETDLRVLLSSELPFANENDLTGFIESNIERFTVDVLEETLASYEREWCLAKSVPFGARRPRIDFLITTKAGKRIGVECKRPSQEFAELSRAVSQLLSYGVVAETNGVPLDRLVLVTTGYTDIVRQVIAKYHLPIEVYVLSRNWTAQLLNLQ